MRERSNIESASYQAPDGKPEELAWGVSSQSRDVSGAMQGVAPLHLALMDGASVPTRRSTFMPGFDEYKGHTHKILNRS